MRLDNPRYRAFCAYRLAFIAVIVLGTSPATSWAETETPPPSRLRNPLSGVTRFLGPAPHETDMRRQHLASLPRREARIHIARRTAPTYPYAYAYVPYYYAYPRLAWPGYRYWRYAYYYSPIPGFAGH